MGISSYFSCVNEQKMGEKKCEEINFFELIKNHRRKYFIAIFNYDPQFSSILLTLFKYFIIPSEKISSKTNKCFAEIIFA